MMIDSDDFNVGPPESVSEKVKDLVRQTSDEIQRQVSGFQRQLSDPPMAYRRLENIDSLDLDIDRRFTSDCQPGSDEGVELSTIDASDGPESPTMRQAAPITQVSSMISIDDEDDEKDDKKRCSSSMIIFYSFLVLVYCSLSVTIYWYLTQPEESVSKHYDWIKPRVTLMHRYTFSSPSLHDEIGKNSMGSLHDKAGVLNGYLILPSSTSALIIHPSDDLQKIEDTTIELWMQFDDLSIYDRNVNVLELKLKYSGEILLSTYSNGFLLSYKQLSSQSEEHTKVSLSLDEREQSTRENLHITITYGQNEKLIIYVNGNPQISTITIKSSLYDSITLGNGAVGKIDEVRIWNGLMAPPEVSFHTKNGLGAHAFSSLFEDRVNSVLYDGFYYSTLTDVSVQTYQSTCQKSAILLPTNWEVAPNDKNSIHVAASYPWSTCSLYLSQGVHVDTNNFCMDANGEPLTAGTVHKDSAHGFIRESDDRYSVKVCDRQILIRKVVNNGTSICCSAQEGYSCLLSCGDDYQISSISSTSYVPSTTSGVMCDHFSNHNHKFDQLHHACDRGRSLYPEVKDLCKGKQSCAILANDISLLGSTKEFRNKNVDDGICIEKQSGSNMTLVIQAYCSPVSDLNVHSSAGKNQSTNSMAYVRKHHRSTENFHRSQKYSNNKTFSDSRLQNDENLYTNGNENTQMRVREPDTFQAGHVHLQSYWCFPWYIGDSECDSGCNNEDNEYDGGDCCPGYQCYDCSEDGYYCRLSGYHLDAVCAYCIECDPGKYAGSGHKVTPHMDCHSCSSGKYASGSGNSECTNCQAGKYAPYSESSACSDCPSGKYTSYEGSSSCSTCSAGKYSNPGSTECTECSVGKYSTYSGSSSCNSCSAGYYSSSTGSTSCSACSSGKYSNSGSGDCSTCPSGKYSNSGYSSCTNCAAGTYAPSSGSSSCSSCPKGKYQYYSGSTTCNECVSGKYASDYGQRSCDVCSAGYYSSSGSTSCIECATGRYSSNGSGSCTKCAIGRYQPNTGSTTCVDCPAGSYSPTEGNYACTPCPSGQTSYPGASGCIAGSFSPTPKSTIQPTPFPSQSPSVDPTLLPTVAPTLQPIPEMYPPYSMQKVLLVTGSPSDSTMKNSWPGWYETGYISSTMTGKQQAYDSQPLNGLILQDSYRSVTYNLYSHFVGMTMQEIVSSCNIPYSTGNQGDATWRDGFCTIGDTATSSGFNSDLSSRLRLGVGDGQRDEEDWILFFIWNTISTDYDGRQIWGLGGEYEYNNHADAGATSLIGLVYTPPTYSPTTLSPTPLPTNFQYLEISHVSLLNQERSLISHSDATSYYLRFSKDSILDPKLDKLTIYLPNTILSYGTFPNPDGSLPGLGDEPLLISTPEFEVQFSSSRNSEKLRLITFDLLIEPLKTMVEEIPDDDKSEDNVETIISESSSGPEMVGSLSVDHFWGIMGAILSIVLFLCGIFCCNNSK